jgi:hypothetical protein
MRGDEFELFSEEFERQIAEHGVPCEFCLRPGEGVGDGEFCGKVPARWFVWPPARYQVPLGIWVCAEHYDILIEKGWTEDRRGRGKEIGEKYGI